MEGYPFAGTRTNSLSPSLEFLGFLLALQFSQNHCILLQNQVGRRVRVSDRSVYDGERLLEERFCFRIAMLSDVDHGQIGHSASRVPVAWAAHALHDIEHPA